MRPTIEDVNVRLPAPLWDEVKELVKAGKREGDPTYRSAAQYVALAVRRQVKKDRTEAA